jgi:hypothetical protein
VEGSPWRVPYSIKVIDPASLSYSRWEEGDTTPGFLNDFALSSIGDVPYVVSAGFYTGVMEVRTSANLGTDWTLVSTNSPPPLSRGFALAGDGDAIYLSGGQAINAYSKPTGVYRSHVWKFDGANWQQRTPSASFAGREGHVMAKVGLRLYVAGGRQASTQFNDLWMSIDEGINWNQVASMLPPALGRPTCALDWQGRLLLIGNSVVSSADGTTWTEHGGRPASFPSGSTQCAVMNGRLFINAKDGNSQAVSTNDLATWQLERPMSMWSNAPGMAAVNGRLLITTGSGTTYLPTYRTVP